MGKRGLNLWLIGDPIIDVYRQGYYNDLRFITEKVRTVRGGAANTAINLRAMTCAPTIVQCRNEWSIGGGGKELIRLVDRRGRPTVEYWNHIGSTNNMLSRHPTYPNNFNYDSKNEQVDHALVVSDYNKGSVNMHARNIRYPATDYVFAVVDSRYRSFNPAFMGNSNCKIWHATGEEYCQEWAENFDWTIHTNGPGPVYIYDRSDDILATLQVPDTPINDVTGAGDTFTAALAAYLSTRYNTGIDLLTIQAAAEFAISACQEVVQIKYCAAPRNHKAWL